MSQNSLLKNIITDDRQMTSAVTSGQVVKALSSFSGPFIILFAIKSEQWDYFALVSSRLSTHRQCRCAPKRLISSQALWLRQWQEVEQPHRSSVGQRIHTTVFPPASASFSSVWTISASAHSQGLQKYNCPHRYISSIPNCLAIRDFFIVFLGILNYYAYLCRRIIT